MDSNMEEPSFDYHEGVSTREVLRRLLAARSDDSSIRASQVSEFGTSKLSLTNTPTQVRFLALSSEAEDESPPHIQNVSSRVTRSQQKKTDGELLSIKKPSVSAKKPRMTVEGLAKAIGTRKAEETITPSSSRPKKSNLQDQVQVARSLLSNMALRVTNLPHKSPRKLPPTPALNLSPTKTLAENKTLSPKRKSTRKRTSTLSPLPRQLKNGTNNSLLSPRSIRKKTRTLSTSPKTPILAPAHKKSKAISPKPKSTRFKIPTLSPRASRNKTSLSLKSSSLTPSSIRNKTNDLIPSTTRNTRALSRIFKETTVLSTLQKSESQGVTPLSSKRISISSSPKRSSVLLSPPSRVTRSGKKLLPLKIVSVHRKSKEQSVLEDSSSSEEKINESPKLKLRKSTNTNSEKSLTRVLSSRKVSKRNLSYKEAEKFISDDSNATSEDNLSDEEKGSEPSNLEEESPSREKDGYAADSSGTDDLDDERSPQASSLEKPDSNSSSKSSGLADHIGRYLLGVVSPDEYEEAEFHGENDEEMSNNEESEQHDAVKSPQEAPSLSVEKRTIPKQIFSNEDDSYSSDEEDNLSDEEKGSESSNLEEESPSREKDADSRGTDDLDKERSPRASSALEKPNSNSSSKSSGLADHIGQYLLGVVSPDEYEEAESHGENDEEMSNDEESEHVDVKSPQEAPSFSVEERTIPKQIFVNEEDSYSSDEEDVENETEEEDTGHSSDDVEHEEVPMKKKTKSENRDILKPLYKPLRELFKVFCSQTITKEAFKQIDASIAVCLDRLVNDLVAFSNLAKRRKVDESDIKLIFRRNNLMDDTNSFYELVRKYLPMCYRKQIIPCALPGNIIRIGKQVIQLK